MKISYLVTCHNEDDTLNHLMNYISSCLNKEDEIVILHDDITNPKTKEIIDRFSHFTIGYDKLNNDYGRHKNVGNILCKNDWIFQIDGDECPSNFLVGENLHTIINTAEKEGVELIYVPRVNSFKGVTEEHAKQWNWKLSPSTNYGGMMINFPDYQGRIYKRIPERIKWERKLHEKIVGHDNYSFLPPDEDYALLHDKTIEKQIQTNLRYNKNFSEADNKGHVIK